MLEIGEYQVRARLLWETCFRVSAVLGVPASTVVESVRTARTDTTLSGHTHSSARRLSNRRAAPSLRTCSSSIREASPMSLTATAWSGSGSDVRRPGGSSVCSAHAEPSTRSSASTVSRLLVLRLQVPRRLLRVAEAANLKWHSAPPVSTDPDTRAHCRAPDWAKTRDSAGLALEFCFSLNFGGNAGSCALRTPVAAVFDRRCLRTAAWRSSSTQRSRRARPHAARFRRPGPPRAFACRSLGTVVTACGVAQRVHSERVTRRAGRDPRESVLRGRLQSGRRFSRADAAGLGSSRLIRSSARPG
jgi:hypothetical protein